MGIIERKKDQLAKKLAQRKKLDAHIARLEYEIQTPEKTEKKYQNYRKRYESKKTKNKPLEREEEKKGWFENFFEGDE